MLKMVWVENDILEGGNSEMISIPMIPKLWIRHSGIQLAGNGVRTRVDIVLHRVSGVFEYAIHAAYVDNDHEWAYESGLYYDTVLEAEKGYNRLCKEGRGA